MHKNTALLVLFLLACSCMAFGQGQTIKGTITDETNKQPVASATIVVKGTRVSATADANGAFTIAAPTSRVTLIISSIGFATKEVSAEAGNTLAVSLSADNRQLGEVVVTALGIQRQAKSLVFATQTIKPQQLTEVRDPNNVLNSLQGKVANALIVQGSGGPGSGARIVLRGNRSIQGTNNALIVVDGIPINNGSSGGTSDFGSVQSSDGASNINPDDIESMTVLRGASAAALYGSAAGNGAIIITTKKGAKDKLAVSVNSGAVAEKAWSLPQFQNTYGQGVSGNLDAGSGQSWGAKMTGQSITDFLGKQTTYSPQPDNVKDFFATGSSFNNSIAVSGGNDKMQTYTSYTNNTINGIIPYNSLNRHTVTVRVTNQVNKWFTTDAKVTYISQDIKNRPRTGEENSPTIDIYNAPRNLSNGEMAQYQTINNLGVPTPTPYPSPDPGIYQNPYWMIHNTWIDESRNRVIGFLSAKFTITPWLSFTGRANLDRQIDKGWTVYYQGTTLWAHTGGYYMESNQTTSQKWFDGIFEGNNKITNDLKLNYHVGALYQDNTWDYLGSTADGLNVTNKFSLKYATSPSLDPQGNQVQTHAAFGQAQISWKDAVFLDGTFRNDWDSRLPSPYTFQYYCAGVTAVISDLMALPQAFSFLKASLNYSDVGNGGQFGLRNNEYDYGQGAGNGFLTRGTTVPFPGLKPEIVKQIEANVEVKFAKDRFGINASYYKSNSHNQLLNIPLPVATGYNTKYINAGNIQNKGLELVLSATPVRQKDFNWDISLNFSFNRNKIITLTPDLKVVYLAGGFGRSATPQVQEGGSYGDLISFQWAKNSKGQYEVDSAAGTPIVTNGGTQAYIGNFNPRETMGMTNTFRYKRFNARVLVDGRIGGIIVDGTEQNLSFKGITKNTLAFREGGLALNGYTASGTPISKTITAQDFWQTVTTGRYGTSQFFAYSATSFRLRELTLGYDIPLTSTFIKSARVNLVGRNLLWLYRGKSILDIPGIGKRKLSLDPDMSLSNNNFQGISYGTLPSTRSYGVNLQFTF